MTQWEGGVRTPALVWSPLLKHHDHVSRQLMHITDWFPTLLSAAGLDSKTLASLDIDGVDQWKALVNNAGSARTKMAVQIDELRNIYAVRRGNWKLVQGNYISYQTQRFNTTFPKFLNRYPEPNQCNSS